MEITMEMVKKLREQTNAGIMDCKKALQQSNGDFAGAEKYLKEAGLAAVAKRSDRATDNGRVSFTVGENFAAMCEVSCETDFVAMNDQFKKLGQDICDYAVANKVTAADDKMEGMVNDLIAVIHENMKLKKFTSYAVGSDNYVVGYNHGNGKIGVLVEFKASDKAAFAAEGFKDFAFNVAMHVCAADPQYLDEKCVPSDYENEQLDIFRAQVASMGKPANVLEGIVKGKLKKLYAEICLLDQVFQFYNDDNLSTKQILDKFNKDHGTDIAIVSYKRFLAGA